MTARDTEGTKGDIAAGRGAQRRLAEACTARDWDELRTAADAGASAYRNDILDRLLEMPETHGLVETIEWLGRHHAARGDRLDGIGGDAEVACRGRRGPAGRAVGTCRNGDGTGRCQ